MKKLLYIPVLMIAAILLSFATTQTEIDKTNAATKTFLLEMNDARMMDLEEGKQAAQKGTTNEVRQYGEKMIKEQTYLLKQFQIFAFSKKIELPKSISDKKLNALNDLKEKTGKDLDKKFISMICIDHTRDVKKFKKALQSDDLEVAKFASQHLPMIQDHLAEIKTIKKNYK